MSGVRRAKIEYRVEDAVYEHLLELVEDAKARGAKDVTVHSMARALMQSAMGQKMHVQLANEVLLRVYRLRKQIDGLVGDMLDANVPGIIERVTGGKLGK